MKCRSAWRLSARRACSAPNSCSWTRSRPPAARLRRRSSRWRSIPVANAAARLRLGSPDKHRDPPRPAARDIRSGPGVVFIAGKPILTRRQFPHPGVRTWWGKRFPRPNRRWIEGTQRAGQVEAGCSPNPRFASAPGGTASKRRSVDTVEVAFITRNSVGILPPRIIRRSNVKQRPMAITL